MPELTEAIITDSMVRYEMYGCERARGELLKVAELPDNNPLKLKYFGTLKEEYNLFGEDGN